MPSAPGSVTCWITQLKAGERAAAQPLWEGYFRQLVARARRQLQGVLRSGRRTKKMWPSVLSTASAARPSRAAFRSYPTATTSGRSSW